ncbi:band 4.1-like protein 2 isoform X3 [Latimeria chalumnae]|uniref:band 4.1-like protein 2 isoform X3 n=1 Tax=Latimeria chalumnae TaxID=7897 RepID=UPI00313BB741
MATEVSSETEVKKDSEQPEQQPPASEPQQQELEQQNVAKSATRSENQEAAAAAAAIAATPAEEKEQPPQPEEQQPQDSSLDPSSQGSPGSEKKEKDPQGGKGLSRFLPPWLKRQKSLTLGEPKEGAGREEQAPCKEAVVGEKEQLLEAGEARTKSEVEKGAGDEQQQSKAVDKEEKHSVSSAETQSAKEDQKEDTLERDSKIIQEKEEKEGKTETKEVQTSETTVEKSPQKPVKKMKAVQCKVLLLDGTECAYELEKRAKGQVLFDKVTEQLNLLERDYFGLTYRDNNDQKNWLDPAKEIKRQIRNFPWQFAFNVKFYPPDPSQLTEDITRYFLCLQLRQDIATGRLPCSFVTHALLGSYTLQAELGDYDPEEQRTDYVSEFQFSPNQSKELEEKVIELHKTHRGQTPAQADSHFLENAKKLSMYGVDLHHAKDSEGVDIMLGVCANGLLIYKDRLRINRFAWPKILKISYKRSNFYIKIRPSEMEQFESTIGFKLPNHRSAKRLWKVCVEHHTFFRLVSPDQPPKAKFLTLGSKFRYSGRTQAQSRKASTLIDRPAPYFERTSSKRVSRSLDGAPVGSITDQSLLKVSPATEATSPGTVIAMAVEKVTGKEGVPAVTPHLELPKDTQVETEQSDAATAAPTEAETTESNSLRIEGENIYVRHSNLMLEDLDRTQEDVLKHQASISELKRSFMESTPTPRPNEWEKRLVTPLSLQTQGSLEEEITTILLSKEGFSTGFTASFVCSTRAAEGTAVKDNIHPETVPESADEKLKSETEEQAEVVIEEAVIIEEVKKTAKVEIEPVGEVGALVLPAVEQVRKENTSSSENSSESEDEAEYHPQTKVATDELKEEEEEDGEDIKRSAEELQAEASSERPAVSLMEVKQVPDSVPLENKIEEVPTKVENVLEETNEKNGEEREQPKVNGDMPHIDVTATEIICCSEPPVVKTEMVTISDSAQKTEVATKEVPIVHTETKTITYEAAQVDGSGDSEPGVLMSAQTITSESVSTTTTTHITKMVKGGVSETRIEKRIVITGDADIDHDQALAQAIKEAKEQHPDMSVTRVVVHKETELTEEGED